DQRADAGDLGVWLLGRLSGNPDDRFTIAVTSADWQAPAAIQRVIVEASVAEGGASSAATDRFDAQPLAGGARRFVFPAGRFGAARALGRDADRAAGGYRRREGLDFRRHATGRGATAPRRE